MRHRVTMVVAALVTGVAASVFAPVALGDSPAPVAGNPSCNGLIVALFNHDSGVFGPSGNPASSAGPGVFLGPATHDAIQNQARGPNCTP